MQDREWDDHLSWHAEATFYHTRIWSRILQAAFPALRDAGIWLSAPGARATLPLHEWRRLGGAWTTLQSSFPFLYGGPVPRRIGEVDLMAEALRALADRGRSYALVGNPFAPGPAQSPKETSVSEDRTHILTLPATHEEYWDGVLSTAKRNDVRRLTKKGVTVRLDEDGAQAGTIYRFYRLSFARWGGRPGLVYPEGLYRAMLRLGEGHVRLYVAEHEGRVLGGAFIVRWNGHVHYHAGYFDHEARSLRPNVLLQERIIRDAIADRFRDYDFLPSGGNRGVEEFKESFGGEPVPIFRYSHASALHRLAALLRGRRAASERQAEVDPRHD